MSLISTFGERVDRPMKTANDLMNWIVFGDNERFYKPNKTV